jgi:hypothetical protein
VRLALPREPPPYGHIACHQPPWPPILGDGRTRIGGTPHPEASLRPNRRQEPSCTSLMVSVKSPDLLAKQFIVQGRTETQFQPSGPHSWGYKEVRDRGKPSDFRQGVSSAVLPTTGGTGEAKLARDAWTSPDLRSASTVGWIKRSGSTIDRAAAADLIHPTP